MSQLSLAILHSTIRKEEKLIYRAAQKLCLEVKWLDIRDSVFNSATFKADFDIALERSVSTIKGNYAAAFLESVDVPVINSSSVSAICCDKFLTSLTLMRSRVPTPRFAMIFSIDQAGSAVEELGGFPVIVKPPLGSWGRLLAKANDMDALETILEHKTVLGTPPHKAFYLQEYIHKPGRDIRVFVLGGESICAIYRESSHWITNTARGGKTYNCPVTGEIRSICAKASSAVGGGILAIDLFETGDGIQVNEVNHTMEFRNSEEPTGVDIAQAIVNYCIKSRAG
jgi:[lysine-biosynthesis-protein LysW]--L-2-aminoadipate ligase